MTGNPFAAEFQMPSRADALAWGILLALGWREPSFRSFVEKNLRALNGVFALLLLGVASLAWWLAKPPGTLTLTIGISWLGAFYCCLLLVVLAESRSVLAGVMRWNWLRKLGAVSYCVYIIHDTINLFAHQYFFGAEPQLYNFSGIAVTAFSLLLTLSIAGISWRLLEQPLIRRGHNYSYQPGNSKGRAELALA